MIEMRYMTRYLDHAMDRLGRFGRTQRELPLLKSKRLYRGPADSSVCTLQSGHDLGSLDTQERRAYKQNSSRPAMMAKSRRATCCSPSRLIPGGSWLCCRHRHRWWLAAKLIHLAITMGLCRTVVGTAAMAAPHATGLANVRETTSGSDVFMHPKAPSPPPKRSDAQTDSTFVRLEFVEGAWDLILDNGTPDSEVRALMDRICIEAGESNPQRAGAGFAAAIAATKYGYERTAWWFETGGALHVFERYLADLVTSAVGNPVRILEVGSFEGGSALWFATNLLSHPRSFLVCIDTWAGGPDLAKAGIDMSPVEARFLHNMAKAPNNQRVTAIKGDSVLSLATLITAGQSSTFDAIYVDGGHTMTNALSDTLLSFRLLKVGGLLIVDDMVVSMVEAAMAAVIESLGGEHRLEVLYNEEQLVLRKTAEDRWATQASVVTVAGQSSLL